MQGDARHQWRTRQRSTRHGTALGAAESWPPFFIRHCTARLPWRVATLAQRHHGSSVHWRAHTSVRAARVAQRRGRRRAEGGRRRTRRRVEELRGLPALGWDGGDGIAAALQQRPEGLGVARAREAAADAQDGDPSMLGRPRRRHGARPPVVRGGELPGRRSARTCFLGVFLGRSFRSTPSWRGGRSRRALSNGPGEGEERR